MLSLLVYSIQPLWVTYNSSGPGKDDVQADDKSACYIIMWQGISKFKEGLCKARMEFSPVGLHCQISETCTKQPGVSSGRISNGDG